MNKAWLDQWLASDASVLRRAVADVQKSEGGGNTNSAELVSYLGTRNDGPFTVLEIDAFYILVRGHDKPTIVVHAGKPVLT